MDRFGGRLIELLCGSVEAHVLLLGALERGKGD